MNTITKNYNIIHEIKQRIPIDQIFYQCFPGNEVIRRGNKLWSCCPFYGEKTPSFYMDTLKNRFYCFSCHASGSAIDLYGKAYNLDIRQAIKALADQLGISRDPSPQAKEAAKQAVQKRQKYKVRENLARSIMQEQYSRLCDLEKACYRIIDSIKTEHDLDRLEVVEALKTKDKIAYWLNSWQFNDDAGRLEIALMVRGVAI
jgi:DNA primase